MSNNAQKTPFVKTMNLFAQRKAEEAIDRLGYALPGHVDSVNGAFVTVSFDVAGLTLYPVTMPIYGAEYIRLPIQPKDKGVAFPASVDISYTAGINTTAAGDGPVGNLSALVWFPIGSKKFSASDNPNALVMYGPDGVILRDSGSASVLNLSSTGTTFLSDSLAVSTSGNAQIDAKIITLSAGGHTLQITSTGVFIDGIPFATHAHTGVESGPDNTGPVSP